MSEALTNSSKKVSLVVPVYKNEENLDQLVSDLLSVKQLIPAHIELVMVIDGSPDNCWSLLTNNPTLHASFDCRFVRLSRNFGALSAVRRGLQEASGDVICVFAADGQEPPSLIVSLVEPILLRGSDVVVGVRSGRKDPIVTTVLSNIFWMIFRRLGGNEIPRRGVDTFAISRRVSEVLTGLPESSTSLIGLLYWTGFAREEVVYTRSIRLRGKSSWTFRKRAKYALDSITSFSEAPIAVLVILGILGLVIAAILGLCILLSTLFWPGSLPHPSLLVLGLTIGFSIQSFGLGVIGMYVWRISENVRGRPWSIDWQVVRSDVANLSNHRLPEDGR